MAEAGLPLSGVLLCRYRHQRRHNIQQPVALVGPKPVHAIQQVAGIDPGLLLQ
jgi:hypothetical protein